MLKLILGVTGIGLILLGVFGDKPLNDVYDRVAGHSSNPVAIEVPAVAESSVTSAAITKEITPVVEPTAGSVEIMTGNAQAVSELQSQLPVVVASDPVVPVSGSDMVAVGEEVFATAVDQAPAITLSSDTTAKSQSVSEQQLASARNDQVELAKTILSSTEQTQPLDVGVEVKVNEVDNLLASTAGQAGNEVLVVIKDKVNLREGPSIDHPVVLQLQNGQELMEFKREGKWVHVGAYGTSGKIGWVHERLVGNSD